MFIHFAFAFVCSVIFAIVLTYVFKRHAPGPLNGVLYFFGIIFLFTVGLGFMLTPIGPMYKNVPWLSIIAISLLIMLLIAELLPHKEKGAVVKVKAPRKEESEEEKEKDEEALEKEFSVFLVLIAVIFIAAVIYVIFSHGDKFKMTF